MLKTIKLASLSYKKSIWAEFDESLRTGQTAPEISSLAAPQWIVSDLKTKIFLNRSLLENREIILGSPVKRAAELWIDLLRDSFPEIVPVGSLGQWALAEKFLKTDDFGEWSQRPGAPQLLLDFCKQMVSLVSHELAFEVIEEFSELFQSQVIIFPSMVKTGALFFEFCLQQKRMPRFFIPSLLLKRPERLPKDQFYYFDLGFEILESEKQLVDELARLNEVQLLVPDSESKISPTENIEVWRCASPDAEARKAVEKISQWIAKGVKAEEICIATTDISVYENILDHDLSWQGLSTQRDLSSPIAGLEFFRKLNSQLKILLGGWDATDLFEAFPNIKPDEKRFLKPAMDIAQVAVPAVQEELRHLFSKSKSSKTELSFTDFERLILKIADRDQPLNQSYILKILSRIKAELDFSTHSLRSWLEAWQKSVTQTDFTYKRASGYGVWAVDFSSIEEVPAKYFIILGAKAESRGKEHTQELSTEAFKFFFDAGFTFQKENSDWTSSLSWFLESDIKGVVVSCALSNQNGEALTPSSFWLNLAKTQGKDLDLCDSANETNWMRVQSAIAYPEFQGDLDKIKNWKPGRTAELYSLVESEMRETKPVHLKLENVRLSPSGIEKLWKCSFKTLAEKGFALRDDPDLEIDPTPSMRGQILHAAAEKTVTDGLENWNRESLVELIDGLGEIQKMAASDIWPSARNRMVRQIERFIDFEKQWRKDFPEKFETFAELIFSGFISWDMENKKLELSPENVMGLDNWIFGGRADRVDVNSRRQAVLIDYKDRSSQLTNIKSWKAQGQFQLALYSQALKAGLAQLDEKDENGINRKLKIDDVIGAFYYSLRNLNRNRGFGKSDSEAGGFLPLDLQKNALTTSEALETHFAELGAEIGQALEKLKQGDFTPYPRDGKIEKICMECAWKRLCRNHQLL